MKHKKLFFLGIAGFFVLSLLLLFFSRSFRPSVLISPITTGENGPGTDLITYSLKFQKEFNILLLGYGGLNHDGAYLTDSIMVAHVVPATHTVYLVTLPRDLWVNLPLEENKANYRKINAAFAVGMDDKNYPNKPEKYRGQQGAKNLTTEMVTLVTGLKIDRFVGLDFKGFEEIIDTLGGVTIQLDRPFDDFSYPVEGLENDMCGKTWETMTESEKKSPLDALPTVFPCRYEHFHLDSGIAHLDGKAALKYVRSRHSQEDGTDFGRSNRQRKVISAVAKKILSLSTLPKILPLYQSLKAHVITDFSLEEMAAAALNYKELEKYNFVGVALTDENILANSTSSDRQFILIPRSGLDSWQSVHNWITGQLAPTPTSTPQSTPSPNRSR